MKEENIESPYHKLLEDGQIVLSINNGPEIKINEVGFYWNGKLVANDKEIYFKFKEWLNLAHKLDLGKSKE